MGYNNLIIGAKIATEPVEKLTFENVKKNSETFKPRKNNLFGACARTFKLLLLNNCKLHCLYFSFKKSLFISQFT